MPEVRSVPECGPGHDEPVPARRSLRDRRRRGDRSGPGPLRAFHALPADAEQQPDQRAHLRADYRPRAARRLSGQDGAGDSARDQRDQGRLEEGVGRRGRGDRRDRRHGGRHRIAAVPGSHPPDAPRGGTRQLPVRPRDPGAVDRGGAGAQDQADAAQREGTAGARYPAGYSAVPVRAIHPAGDEGKDRPVLRRGRARGDHGARRPERVCGAGGIRGRGRGRDRSAPAEDRRRSARSHQVDGHVGATGQPARARYRSRWWGSTWNTKIPTRA